MDPVDKAIAAGQRPQAIAMEQREVNISSTGRPFIVAYPTDLTEAELFEVVGWMANNLRIGLAQRRAASAGPRIVLPTGPVPV